MKLSLGQDSEARFGQDEEMLMLMLRRDSEDEMCLRFVLELVI